MKTPTWSQCLVAITLLAIAGFALVILSGFWHVLALLLIAVAAVWLCVGPASPKK
jgi:1,4-dihydroxy-2-naphthoate octaprenyltransferase